MKNNIRNISSMDADKAIANLFGEINTPTYDILEGVKLQMNQKNKKSRPRVRVLVLVAIFTLLLTSGAVFAAYQTAGGFGRLRGIVGEERAENLTPIEADEILDIPYLSGGFRNPHEDRFAIELVATYGEVGGIMDFYFTLEDLTGARRDCEFNALSFTLHTGDGFYVHGNAEPINICENGIITVRGRTNGMSRSENGQHISYYGTWSSPPFVEGYVPEELVRDGEITITVTQVAYNTGYTDATLGFDLGTVREFSADELQYVTKSDFAEDFPFDWQFPREEDRILLEATGVPLPRLDLLNWEIDVPRVEAQIASIGILDGDLYLVQYEPMPHYSRFTGLFLQGPNGDRINPTHSQNNDRAYPSRTTNVDRIHASRSMMFNVSDDGTFFQWNYRRDTAITLFGMGYFSRNPYQILIFEGLDLDRLGEYSIAGHFDTGASIWLEWTTSFVVE